MKLNEGFDKEDSCVSGLLKCVSEYVYNPYKMQDFQSGIRIAKAMYQSFGSTTANTL